MPRSKAQLNAISRSYTNKAKAGAIKELREVYGVDYSRLATMFSYKASPVRLLTDIKYKKQSTLTMINQYQELTGYAQVRMEL